MANLEHVPTSLVDSLLRSVFGMFCDPEISTSVRGNITLLAAAVWSASTEDAKRAIGLQYAKYEVNADLKRRAAARAFLDLVGGLSYLPEGTLAVAFNSAMDSLISAHFGYGNFYNELAPAQTLASMVPDTGEIPASARQKYVKTLLICRLGNSHGVSIAALPIYNALLRKFRDIEVKTAVVIFRDDQEVSTILRYEAARNQVKDIISLLNGVAIGSKVKQVLQFLSNLDLHAFENLRKNPRLSALLEAP